MQTRSPTFRPMTREDVAVLAPIMKRSFDDDARLHTAASEGGPPGYDDGSFLDTWAFHPDATAFRIDFDGRPIGGMILFVHEDQAFGHLGCLFIDSDRIGQGFGSAAWRFAEKSYPMVRTWTVDTPAVSYRNHCFYINKCGFHVVAVEGGRDRSEAQFRLKKNIE